MMDFAGFDMLPSQSDEMEGIAGERRESGKRGRKPGRKAEKTDMKQKLERSRQSARECRARKKLRYQYLEELVADREKAVFALREELEKYRQWSLELVEGRVPPGFDQLLEEVAASSKPLGFQARGGKPTSIAAQPRLPSTAE